MSFNNYFLPGSGGGNPMGGAGAGGAGAQFGPMGGGAPGAPPPKGSAPQPASPFSEERLQHAQNAMYMSPMQIGSRVRDAQQALQAAQLAGADPYRIMQLQNQLSGFQNQAQNYMSQRFSQLMNPGLGGVGKNRGASPPGISFGQESLWQQLISMLGLGGGDGGGASTPML